MCIRGLCGKIPKDKNMWLRESGDVRKLVSLPNLKAPLKSQRAPRLPRGLYYFLDKYFQSTADFGSYWYKIGGCIFDALPS